ncbi:DUF4886 domain-containing protein [Candidatus Xianfuyuplasma coldseepsis]|uniref:DUF4886 domain-containing protein n=1 Tax=Candidatus Xianfuyuplasma coldseepsis TaxID=2782163 RepID=A0A7L7KV66_9MOLU|nr:DUF4886 domain-containing protein [Xianfuyuplasma coldseepsis]QMS85658.1 DUF4886 domain-containing protein [Xianfuyuplasma coldseepsis]
MKKIMLSMLFVVLFLLTSCKDDTIFTIENTIGPGPLDDPFIATIYPDETTMMQLTVPRSMARDFVAREVVVEGDTVTPISSENSSITIDVTDDYELSLTPLKLGTKWIEFSGGDKTYYLEVQIMKRDIDFTKQLRILGIGNSFTEDAMEYLYHIADDYGVEEIILGYLYIGGAPLSTHVEMIETEARDYRYYDNTKGYWAYHSSYTIEQGITEQEWDLISIQQASYDSGRAETYNDDITTLIDFIFEHAQNKNVRIMWHMTWAYQATSNHSGFVNYDNDQMTMYNAIINAVQTKIVPDERFDLIIPSGTAIQNVRTSYIGDTLTRDGFHLSYDQGRYIAGLTWFKEITGFSINEITYKPEGITDTDQQAIVEGVNYAVETPFEITPSTFTEE